MSVEDIDSWHCKVGYYLLKILIPLGLIAIIASIAYCVIADPPPPESPLGEEGFQELLNQRDNINKFIAYQNSIASDGIIDVAELQSICSDKSHWQQELEEAFDYTDHYLEADPLVAYNNIDLINDMQDTANLGLEWLRQAPCP